jgi:sialate O-acetylesterase
LQNKPEFPNHLIYKIMNKTTFSLIVLLVSCALCTSLWAQRYTPVVDTYIAQNTSTTSYGTSSTLLVRTSASFNRVTFLEFNIGDFSQQITNAELSLYLSAVTNAGTETVDVFEVTSGTITNTITWSGFNTAYTLAADRITSLDIASSYRGWCKFQIKDLVNAVAAKPGTDKKIKLAIKARTSALLLTFQSSESTIPDYSPSLILNNEADTIGVNGPSTIIMPTLFSDNMVLQREKPIKVWGEVLANEPVTITFADQVFTTQCDANGKFAVYLPAKNVSSEIYTMKIKANADSVIYSNIVIGDVYLCGGQSNMAFKVTSIKSDQLANAKADSNYPNLRHFEAAKIVNGGVLTGDVDKPWIGANSERVLDWSAVAFFVGRDLHKHLNIPIGLINVSHGGTPSDAFISPEAYASDPVLNAAKRPDGTGVGYYYQTPSSIYNAKVSKIVGYPIKAVLWYQAEANAVYWQNFKTIFKGLLKDWRTKWNEPALPWIFVQLPTYEPTNDPTFMTWAETRDIQLQVWKEDPNTGMAVTMDLGNPNDIHPTDKYNVAKRMLPIVKAMVYGENVIHKSPVYKSHKVVGSDVFVTFENSGSGLKSVKEITEFEIAAADKVYKAATAVLLPDNSIKLSNATLTNPIYVRYAFRNNSTISIFTSDEFPLPLSPFRSDVPEEILSGFKKNFTEKLAEMYYENNQLYIKSILNEGLNVNLYSMQGKKIYHQLLHASESLQLSNLMQRGLYLLKVSDRNTEQVFKIQL